MRNCAPVPPRNPKAGILIYPRIHNVAYPQKKKEKKRSLGKKKKNPGDVLVSLPREKRKVDTFFFQIKRKREGNLVTAHRRQIAGPRSRNETAGHFSPAASQKKKEAQHREGEKKNSLPQNSYTPFSTLTLIVPSILRYFLRTSTTSQT